MPFAMVAARSNIGLIHLGEQRRIAKEFTIVPVAHAVGGRAKPTDDHWGGTRSIVRINPDFPPDSTEGLAEFSHLEIVFRFHLTDPTDLHPGARRPRDNPGMSAPVHLRPPEHATPELARRLWCRLIKVDGLDLHVGDLDTLDGTPVLDIKPWFVEMGPRGIIRQPAWTTDMLADYFATPND
jgi:tRNA (Thr-GGU) A37 N-methylase